MTDLNSLISSNSGWVLEFANGINDSGQIVGFGRLDGVTHGFLLTPTAVPEPGSLALAGIAMTLGVAYSWSRRRRSARD